MNEHVDGALADAIFDAAVLRGEFVLRSGARSDRYFDKYRALTQPSLLTPIVAAFAQVMTDIEPRAEMIVAPALGAVPLAVALSLASGLPYVIVRDGGKEHGTARQIEGVVRPGLVAVLIEDVVTSGGAALNALEAARDAGLHVAASMCVLDRDQGGRERLAAASAPLTALLTAADLDLAVDRGAGALA